MFNTTSVNSNSHQLLVDKRKEFFSLAVLSTFCVVVFGLRVYISGSLFFMFLIWNLFLAFIPWAISSILLLSPRLRNLKVLSIGLMLCWVAFFPNAPYILTDLVHLKHNLSMPLWFDLILILTFAWTGLLFGFASLRDVALICRQKLSVTLVNIMISGFLFLASFGIYIGRYLRWNSWDIVSKPAELIADLTDIILHPFVHPKAWGMTLLLGVMLNIIYWTFRPMRQRKL